ncbi:MAG: hypothetical protein ACE5JF_02830 [Anaerolineales bacterium]
MQSGGVRQAIVVGGLMILFGVLQLVQEFIELDAWTWAGVLIASGLGVYWIYSLTRDEVWMLIVSYALLAVGIMIALVTLDILDDAIIATYVLTTIAIPFVYGYFRTGRTNWGLLIPAYVMLAVGVMVPLIESGTLKETTIPAYVLFAVALPFFVVFVRNTEQFWGLIVGGILSLASFSLLIAPDLFEFILPAILILVGGGILVRQITQRERSQEITESPTSEL